MCSYVRGVPLFSYHHADETHPLTQACLLPNFNVELRWATAAMRTGPQRLAVQHYRCFPSLHIELASGSNQPVYILGRPKIRWVHQKFLGTDHSLSAWFKPRPCTHLLLRLALCPTIAQAVMSMDTVHREGGGASVTLQYLPLLPQINPLLVSSSGSLTPVKSSWRIMCTQRLDTRKCCSRIVSNQVCISVLPGGLEVEHLLMHSSHEGFALLSYCSGLKFTFSFTKWCLLLQPMQGNSTIKSAILTDICTTNSLVASSVCFHYVDDTEKSIMKTFNISIPSI